MSNSSPDLCGLPTNLREEEALAVENAIRAAVNTVIHVICAACNRRLQEYQRTVADRDKEMRRLESKLEKSESELKVLRLQVGRVRQEDELSCSVSSAENQLKNRSRLKSGGAATPAQISPKCRDTVEAFPRQHAHTDTRESAAASLPSPVKEELSDLETVIKWEVCEGSLLDQQEGQHRAEYLREEKAAEKDLRTECEAKTAHSQTNKWMASVYEDESPVHLKRKGGERNGSHPTDSEEERVSVKKSCVTYPPAMKISPTKASLDYIASQQPQRHNSNASISSNFNAQDPSACQQQTYVPMSAPQPTCDPILLEVLVSLETIKQQNTTVLKILQTGNSSGALLCEPPDVGTLPLPLQSVQDLRSLEHRLCTEPELKKKMISYLGLSGGMTTKESVWRIMAKLFTNTLAKNINWRGRNNKQKIENLTIKRVILNAVRQNSFCKDAVDEEIERYIKRWLQLAGDRDGGRKRRQERGKEATSMGNYCVDEMFTSVTE